MEEAILGVASLELGMAFTNSFMLGLNVHGGDPMHDGVRGSSVTGPPYVVL